MHIECVFEYYTKTATWEHNYATAANTGTLDWWKYTFAHKSSHNQVNYHLQSSAVVKWQNMLI